MNTSYSAQPKNRQSGKKAAPSAARAISPPAPLMRKAGNCACGGGCPRCNKKEKLPVQAKLNVSQPGDALEREADQVADRVLRMPSASTNTSTDSSPQVSRMASSAESSRSATPAVQETLNASGQPLDAATRNFFEPRFGHDFSSVRVHADTQAAASAQSVDARAYTVGSNVVFNAGQYAPRSPSGQRLLAHELTHVVQQSRGSSQALQRKENSAWDCNPDKMSGLGPMFKLPEADVQKLILPERYVRRPIMPEQDYVLYCPHKSTRPLKKLVPCTNVYWIAEAGARGKGKDEVWAHQEGETDMYRGFVKQSKIESTPCVPHGTTTITNPAPTPPAPTSTPTAPAPTSPSHPEPKFGYGHKKSCPQSFLDSHVWPGTKEAMKMVQHSLDALCAALNGNSTARNKEARVQMVSIFGSDWRTMAPTIYSNLYRLKSALIDDYTFDCVSGYDDGPEARWMRTWTLGPVTGGPGGDVDVWIENFEKRAEGTVDWFAMTLIHELGHRFLGLEHGSDETSTTCAGETDDAHCYAVLAGDMKKNVTPGYTGGITDLCLGGGGGATTDPKNWD